MIAPIRRPRKRKPDEPTDSDAAVLDYEKALKEIAKKAKHPPSGPRRSAAWLCDEAFKAVVEKVKQALPDPKGRSFTYRKPFKKVYRFRIDLMHIEPPVWRRIELPDKYSFWDLHVAITDCFGWMDYHLHQFEIVNPKTGATEQIGVPDEDALDVIPDRRCRISSYFTAKNPTAIHQYDFGDGWEHRIELEGIHPRVEGVPYPRCFDGKRACPPEDCGGVGGYGRLLKIIGDPADEEHEDTVGWLRSMKGEGFDPAHFDPAEVRFDDPEKRWRIAYHDEEMTPDMRCWDFFEDKGKA